MDIGVERERTHRRRVENNIYYAKTKGESDPVRQSVADNLLTGYTAYGINLPAGRQGGQDLYLGSIMEQENQDKNGKQKL